MAFIDTSNNGEIELTEFLAAVRGNPNGQATDRDEDAPAQFIAGWFYGIEGEDVRD
jgi:hypothetical protein